MIELVFTADDPNDDSRVGISESTHYDETVVRVEVTEFGSVTAAHLYEDEVERLILELGVLLQKRRGGGLIP